MYESWNRGAEEEMDVFIHPEFEYRTSGAFPGFDSTYRGRDGFAKFRGEMLEAWEYLDLEPKAIHDHGEWLLVELSFHGRGRESGASADLEFHHAAQFRDGLLYRLVASPDREVLQRAAGLREGP
jgi:ketosteroid isomerase-like protein